MTSREVCFSSKKMAQLQTTRFVHDINVMYKCHVQIVGKMAHLGLGSRW